MLDHDARKAAQNHLDAAQKVDATARAVDVAHPDGDALDGTRIPPELFAESPPDVCPVILVEPDPVDSDVRGCQRCRRATSGPLHGPGHLIGEWFSLASFVCGRVCVERYSGYETVCLGVSTFASSPNASVALLRIDVV